MTRTEDSSEARFRVIVLSCALAIDAGLATFLDSDDPAGPHKARVALRRLNTALDAFRPILRRRDRKILRARAKRVFRALGKVRDSDVLLIGDAGKGAARARIAVNRALRERTRRKLRKRRVVGMVGELRRVVGQGGPIYRRSAKAQARRALPAPVLAAAVLDDAWQRCLGYGRSVSAVPAADLHDFRKDLKALRYLAEFFADLYPGLRKDPFRRSLRDIQDALGVMSDFAMAMETAGKDAHGRLPERVRLALDRAGVLWADLSAAALPWEDQPTLRP